MTLTMYSPRANIGSTAADAACGSLFASAETARDEPTIATAPAARATPHPTTGFQFDIVLLLSIETIR